MVPREESRNSRQRWKRGGEGGEIRLWVSCELLKDRTGHVWRPSLLSEGIITSPDHLRSSVWHSRLKANIQLCDTFMRKVQLNGNKLEVLWTLPPSHPPPPVRITPCPGRRTTFNTRQRPLNVWSRSLEMDHLRHSLHTWRDTCAHKQALVQTGSLLISYNGMLLQLHFLCYSLWNCQCDESENKTEDGDRNTSRGPKIETEFMLAQTELHSDRWDIWHRAKKKSLRLKLLLWQV